MIFTKISEKLHEIDKILVRRGDARWGRNPLDLPLRILVVSRLATPVRRIMHPFLVL